MITVADFAGGLGRMAELMDAAIAAGRDAVVLAEMYMKEAEVIGVEIEQLRDTLHRYRTIYPHIHTHGHDDADAAARADCFGCTVDAVLGAPNP